MPSAQVRAFAKINLSLEVLNKRPDGFHNLRTIFQTVSLHDTIHVSVQPSNKPRVELISDVEIPGENLIVRAALAVLEVTRQAADVRFRLEKCIPMGGGLGGGSTDAAAVLLVLPRLLGLEMEAETLRYLATRLGSDVPFFLLGGTALGLGRGTELYPLPDAEASYGLLVAPPVHVATAEAYGLLHRTAELPDSGLVFSPTERLATAIAEGGNWALASVNDFETSVFSRHAVLAELRARLESAGASPARMTGSGAALFGLFASEAQRVAAALEFSAQAGVRTVPFTFVDRQNYRASWQESVAGVVF